jgi:hypothetical protein
MRIVFFLILFVGCFIASTAHADEIAMLTAQVRQLAQTVQSLQTTVEMQQKEINTLKEAQNMKPPSVSAPATGVVSQAPRSSGKFTPEIGVVADTVLKLDSSRQDANGNNRFALRELELVLGSNVDPYSRLDAVISYDDENHVSIEEAYLSRFGLPFNTTARIGVIKPKIGKDLAFHREILDTVDEPLVIQRYFGEDGMSKAGVDFTKLLDIPSPFVHQLTFGVLEGGNGEDGTAFGSLERLPTLYAHLKNFRDINDMTSLEVGNTYAIGSNDGNKEFKTNVIGLDTTLIHHLNSNQDIKLQGEVFYLDRGKVPGDTTNNGWGAYELLDFRLNSLWAMGLQFDYVNLVNNPVTNPKNKDLGPTGYLTFYQSEFARWRLAYSHFYLATGKDDNRVMLQGTFAIGDHKHKLQ